MRRMTAPRARLLSLLRLLNCFLFITLVTMAECSQQRWNLGGFLLWIPNGILLAYLLLAPRWRWWLYMAAAFAAMSLGGTLAGESWQVATQYNLLNLLEVFVSAWLLHPRGRQIPAFGDRRSMLRFVLAAVVLGPFAAALLLAILDLFGPAPDPVARFWGWMVSCAIGTAIATPAFLALLRARLRFSIDWNRQWIAFSLLALTWVAFAYNAPPLIFFIAPLLVIAIMRVGLGQASALLLGVAAISSFYHLHGLGPLANTGILGMSMPGLMFQVMLAASVFLLYTVSAQLESTRATESKLEKVVRLHNLVTENSRDAIIVSRFDRTWHYFSPSLHNLTGYSEADLAGHSLLDIVVPEEVPRLLEAFAALSAGHDPVLLEWQVRRRDNEILWVEGSLSPLHDQQTGQIVGAISFVRDIRARKLAEQKLQEAYRAVEALAITDGLTGIANRRHFDQELTREWRRSHREHTPLSLLMLDIDYFKAYNDTYGHLRGDSCLRQVVEATQDVVARPGDLIARFGGEEFVVLLPDTDSAGANVVAQHIVESLASRDLEHKGSELGRVTISVGCATFIPQFGQHAITLVDAADNALYHAKAQGRNCVCSHQSSEQSLFASTPSRG